MRIFVGNLELPAAPERIDIRQEGRWFPVELAETGEVLLYRPPGLRTVRFQGIFPAERYGFVTAEKFRPPSFCCAELEKLAASRQPFRLVISGGGAPFSMMAVLKNFQRWEQAGEEGDLYFAMELQEYRPFGRKMVSGADAVPVPAPDRAGKPEVPQVYVVQKGDCLWNIAARFLGNGGRYREIAKFNGIPNPNLIFPGQKLKIPGGEV